VCSSPGCDGKCRIPPLIGVVRDSRRSRCSRSISTSIGDGSNSSLSGCGCNIPLCSVVGITSRHSSSDCSISLQRGQVCSSCRRGGRCGIPVSSVIRSNCNVSSSLGRGGKCNIPRRSGVGSSSLCSRRSRRCLCFCSYNIKLYVVTVVGP